MDEDSFKIKIFESLKGKSTSIFSWFNTGEGKIIAKCASTLASFGIGDPTGLLFPFILEISDTTVRKRFLKHFPDLLKRIDTNKNKIDPEFFSSEIGRELLRNTLQEFIKETNDEKIEGLKKFLLNISMKLDIEHETQTQYMNVLFSLSPLELKILNIINSPESTLRQMFQENSKNVDGAIQFDFLSWLRKYLEIPEPILFKSILKLKNENLITSDYTSNNWPKGSYLEQNIEDGITTIKTMLPEMITTFGVVFLQYYLRD